MKTATVKISDQARDVLNRSTVYTNTLVLPAEKLDRALYVEVNKTLEALGGKWNKAKKCHVFEKPSFVHDIKAVIAGGQAVDKKKTFQQFFTPPEIAQELVKDALGAHPAPIRYVLEPSAGQGALVDAVHWALPDARITCVDSDPEMVAQLRTKGYETNPSDFLKLDPTFYAPFDLVIMNPPFTAGQDAKHILHAFKFVRLGGVLAAIVPQSILTKTTKLYKEFGYVHGASLFTRRPLPDDAFAASGTKVKTMILVWKKRS